MAGSEKWAPRRPELQTPAEEESRYTSRVARSRKHLRLPTQKVERWEVWCTVNHKDFQELVEEAIDFYFYNMDAQTPTIRSDDPDRLMTPLPSSRSSSGRPDAQPVENVDDDAENHLLRFYCEATGNTLKLNDRAFYRERLANVAPHIVKIGIVTSVIRNAQSQGGRPINSLRYCEGAIEEMVEAGTNERMVAMLAWSVENRPTYRDVLPPITRDNLKRAFALQPMLPGIGAEVLSIDDENHSNQEPSL